MTLYFFIKWRCFRWWKGSDSKYYIEFSFILTKFTFFKWKIKKKLWKKKSYIKSANRITHHFQTKFYNVTTYIFECSNRLELFSKWILNFNLEMILLFNSNKCTRLFKWTGNETTYHHHKYIYAWIIMICSNIWFYLKIEMSPNFKSLYCLHTLWWELVKYSLNLIKKKEEKKE